MSDFHQNGVITTLHTLNQRPIEEIESELKIFAKKRPMALILPSLFSELEGPALPNIIKQLKEADYIDDIIIGLDRANRSQFEFAKNFFSELPQRTHLLWNDGDRLRDIDASLKQERLSPRQAGKGRNVWFCMGYALALNNTEAVALHDCDIVTYDRYMPARLFYPVANPDFSFEFCKGYYPRVGNNKLGGRVTRLFVTPLIRSLHKIFGPKPYIEFMNSFRYPLSGEFALRRDLIKTMRIPSDWGLEIGVLSEVYRNISEQQVCQVDIAEVYDHKHQDLSTGEGDGGLSKMSREIAKSMFRKLATEGVSFSMEYFRTIKATYYRLALDSIEQFYYDARINNLSFDRHGEEQCVEVFAQSIIEAGQSFINNPMEVPFSPNWNRVASAMPDIKERLLEAVALDNG